MHGLLRAVEGEKAQARLDAGLHASIVQPVSRQALEGIDGKAAEPITLAGDPLLEARLTQPDAFQQVTAVQGHRLHQRGRFAGADEMLEAHHVNVDRGHVERDRLVIGHEHGRPRPWEPLRRPASAWRKLCPACASLRSPHSREASAARVDRRPRRSARYARRPRVLRAGMDRAAPEASVASKPPRSVSLNRAMSREDRRRDYSSIARAW